MERTLLILRLGFIGVSLLGSLLFYWFVADELPMVNVLVIGLGLAALAILADISVKGFSVRGLTALSFGLAMGLLVSYLISNSPLFEPLDADPDLAQTAFGVRLVLFIFTMYLCMVIALRGKDDFNLVIPYVRFTAENVDSPLAVVDTSSLIDGRLVPLCEGRWFSHTLIIPRFVLEELQAIADSPRLERAERGRRGLDNLNRLRRIPHLDLRINDSEVPNAGLVDSKLIFLAESMRAKVLTTDQNLARLAEFQGIAWMNISALVREINAAVAVGSVVDVKLVKPGKDAGQAVGYLPDGSMVVIEKAHNFIGEEVSATIESVVQSAGGKLLFASINRDDASDY